MNMRKSRLLLLLVVVLFSVTSMLADTLYVAAIAEPGSNGQSWNSAFRSMQSALDSVKPGDEIWVAKGLYRAQNSTAGFIIPNNVKIYGGFRGDELLRERRDWLRRRTIFDGELVTPDGDQKNATSVVLLNNCDSTTWLDGIVIRNGDATYSKSNNKGGGGAFVSGGSPQFHNCYFENNQGASAGGGVYLVNTVRVRFEYCAFIKNTAKRGGAIALSSNYLDTGGVGVSIGQCIFSKNTASNDGGALFFLGCVKTPQITSCVFVDNSADSGAGGAIACDDATFPWIIGNTFMRNTLGANSQRLGASIALFGGNVLNCILWGDESAIHELDSIPVEPSNKVPLVVRGCGIRQDEKYNQLPNNPFFVDETRPEGADGLFFTDDDGLRLDKASVLINSGVHNTYLDHRRMDVLGSPRVVESKSDIGAYEKQREGYGDYRKHMNFIIKEGATLMFRHTTTDWLKNGNGPKPECEQDRNLNAEGRPQAISIGKHIRALGIKVDSVQASPVCRTWETAFLMMGRYTPDNLWRSGGDKVADRKASLAIPNALGSSRVISTHDAVMLPLLFDWSTAENHEGDCAVINPNPNAEDGYDILSHYTSDVWERYFVRFPDQDTTSIPNDVVAGEIVAMVVYPNPARTNATLVLPYTIEENLQLQVVSLMGQVVTTMNVVPEGKNIPFALNGLPQGSYIVRVQTNKGMYSARLQVVE